MNRRSFFGASAGAAVAAKTSKPWTNAEPYYGAPAPTNTLADTPKAMDLDYMRKRYAELSRHSRGEFEPGELGMFGYDGGAANIEALKSVSPGAKCRLLMELSRRRQAADLQKNALQELQWFLKSYGGLL